MTVLFADNVQTRFRDRQDAGRRLAGRLEHLRDERPVVLGLPRGGVPVAAEIARALDAPLDVILVRKLGAPFHPEYGIGAIAEGGVRFVDPRALEALGIARETLDRIDASEREVLERRADLYREDRTVISLAGRTAIVVDDGIATGGTAIAAVRAARECGAKKVVLAVPVAPPGAERRLADEVDEFVCLEEPQEFFAVGAFYERFGQTSDEEVRRCLRGARTDDPVAVEPAREDGDADPPPATGGLDWNQLRRREVSIPVDGVRLVGDLTMPPAARGLVIFAHGSGSSRLSPRNIQVAGALNAIGLATLLLDLLTESEAMHRVNVFDVATLAERLVAATRWAKHDGELDALPIGYFGASTGAAAALCAAAHLDGGIRAVVSRGGRPDLAAVELGKVVAPTLLIVGGADRIVAQLNEMAAAELRCPHRLEIIAGATHLFDEPGALERVAELAGHWFAGNLTRVGSPA